MSISQHEQQQITSGQAPVAFTIDIPNSWGLSTRTFRWWANQLWEADFSQNGSAAKVMIDGEQWRSRREPVLYLTYCYGHASFDVMEEPTATDADPASFRVDEFEAALAYAACLQASRRKRPAKFRCELQVTVHMPDVLTQPTNEQRVANWLAMKEQQLVRELQQVRAEQADPGSVALERRVQMYG